MFGFIQTSNQTSLLLLHVCVGVSPIGNMSSQMSNSVAAQKEAICQRQDFIVCNSEDVSLPCGAFEFTICAICSGMIHPSSTFISIVYDFVTN